MGREQRGEHGETSVVSAEHAASDGNERYEHTF
jgi:hypothetical protein